MSKFKVGDRVRCVRVNWRAPVGTEGVIKETVDDIMKEYTVCWDENIGGWQDAKLGIPSGHGEYIPEEYIEPISSYPEIHITTDGKTTFGIMKQGKEVIKRVEAKLHPDDKFNFEVGSKLVMDRLLEKDKKLILFDNFAPEIIFGEVGKETRMVDIYGEKLYVGDSVNVICANSDIKKIRFVCNNFIQGFGGFDFTEPKKYDKYIITKDKSYKNLKVGDILNSIEVEEV